jgi:hypothetical protein
VRATSRAEPKNTVQAVSLKPTVRCTALRPPPATPEEFMDLTHWMLDRADADAALPEPAELAVGR